MFAIEPPGEEGATPLFGVGALCEALLCSISLKDAAHGGLSHEAASGSVAKSFSQLMAYCGLNRFNQARCSQIRLVTGLNVIGLINSMLRRSFLNRLPSQ